MNNFIFSVTLLLLSIFTPSALHAAEIFCAPPVDTPRVGEMVKIDCSLDSQGRAINALEGSVNFTKNIAPAHVDLDGSIVPFWIVIPQARSSGAIPFAGVLPGGYIGVLSPEWSGYKAGKLFTLAFIAREAGEANISFGNDSAVYADNGLGTPVNVSAIGLSFHISPRTALFYTTNEMAVTYLVAFLVLALLLRYYFNRNKKHVFKN